MNDPQQTITAVYRLALQFGEQSAHHIGEGPFADPVLHTYFLLYILGAIDYLGDTPAEGLPLLSAEKLAAMAEALDAFGVASADEIRATVLMLDQAADAAARNIRGEGAAAAERWQEGDGEALQHFAELIKEPANFPAEVDPALAPLVQG